MSVENGNERVQLSEVFARDACDISGGRFHLCRPDGAASVLVRCPRPPLVPRFNLGQSIETKLCELSS